MSVCALIGGAAFAAPPAAAQGCSYFELSSILVNVRRDPSRPGGYLDVLEKGDIACVTEERKIENTSWAFIKEKTNEDGDTSEVGGWANMRYLTPGSAPEASAAAPAEVVPQAKIEVVKPPAPTMTRGPETEPKAADKTEPAAKTEAATVPAKPAAPATPKKTAAVTPVLPSEIFRFDQPVPFGAFPVQGHTLAELLDGRPLFSPIDGLPETLWKKPCTTCHKWNKERLCTQGGSYIKAAKNVLRHQHPYGGPYKLALMRWAKTGCQ